MWLHDHQGSLGLRMTQKHRVHMLIIRRASRVGLHKMYVTYAKIKAASVLLARQARSVSGLIYLGPMGRLMRRLRGGVLGPAGDELHLTFSQRRVAKGT